MATIYALESGIIGEANSDRDDWFKHNPRFVIKQDPNNRLAFISLRAFMMNEDNGESKEPYDYWITTPATLTAKADNGYRRYDTQSGTIYQIVKMGEIR